MTPLNDDMLRRDIGADPNAGTMKSSIEQAVSSDPLTQNIANANPERDVPLGAGNEVAVNRSKTGTP